MRRLKNLWAYAAIVLTTGIIGCNLFNPTEEANINSDDTDALIYEGYIHFRNAEYSVSRDYFERALNVDSTLSEAWYGLSKSVLNQQNLNVFELLKYANSKNGQSGFMSMSDATVKKYSDGIDSVMVVLNEFVDRDSTDRTDKKVTFNTISASYTVLHLTKAAFLMKNASQDLTSMFHVTTNPPSIDIDWNNLKNAGESTVELFSTLGDIGKAVKADPSIATEVIRSYVPEAYVLSDSGLTDATMMMANYLITASNTVEKSSEGILSYVSMGDKIDNDGDGCIDEEIADGQDNDGDGLVDEDMRPNATMVFETDLLHHSVGQVASVEKIDEYNDTDIDGNGSSDADEWTFFVDASNSRNEVNDHRFKAFAVDFAFQNYADGSLKSYMDAVKQDTDVNSIKYDLAWRKAHIGGCWNNYDDATFLKWFEGRN